MSIATAGTAIVEIEYATIANQHSKLLHKHSLEWEALCSAYATPYQIPHTRAEFEALSATQRDEAKGKAGAFCFARFSSNQRSDSNIVSYTALTLDLEGPGTPTFEAMRRAAKRVGVAMWVYTTARYTKEAPRLRVVVPLAKAIKGKTAKNAATRTFAKILEVTAQPESWNNIVAYVPTCMKDTECLQWWCDGAFWEPTVFTLEQQEAETEEGEPSELASPDAAPVPGLKLKDAELMLSKLPPTFGNSNEQWFKVGAAVHMQFGEEGWTMFDEWSQTREGYDEEGNRRRWEKGFRNVGQLFTFRSIAWHAKQTGWQPTAKLAKLVRQGKKEIDEFDDEEALQKRGVNRVHGIASEDFEEIKNPVIHVENLFGTGCYLLVGQPKTHKTWALMEIGLAMATGRPIWGFVVPKPLKVCMLLLEEGEEHNDPNLMHPMDYIKHRWKMMGVAAKDAGKMGYVCELRRGHEYERIEELVKEYDVLIIDSVAKVRGGADEDRSKGPWQADYAFIEPYHILAQRYSRTLLWSMHAGKGANQRDVMDIIAATQGFQAAVDGMLFFHYPDKDDQKRLHFATRPRHMPQFDLELRWDNNAFKLRSLGRWVQLSRRIQDVLDFLITQPFNGPGFTAQQIHEATGVSRPNVVHYVSTLTAHGLATKGTPTRVPGRPGRPTERSRATRVAYERAALLAGHSLDDIPCYDDDDDPLA